MARIIEHDIIQNVGLSALVLHKFVKTYSATTDARSGPDLAIVMPVLPLLYHQKTLDSIHRKRFEGGFFNAIGDYREIPAGLQQRMEDMAHQTFMALNLACQSDIIVYDRVSNELLPSNIPVTSSRYNNEIKGILSGADRLGYWFSTLPFEQVCIMLKLTF
ncbi:three component ABC system middle component [Dyadobacter pollutisoli]|uniref:DUF6521 family protein n=1 Tax=Dyadobacter pollutisoli TaxID=2910158 RepID=A0A9E8NAM1_9BACT|nr:three component ABC system middle component [Dyadobacter pollutisoli]WAC12413.1 DUF6521 family protein [Dyadobacter pollutisoli]